MDVHFSTTPTAVWQECPVAPSVGPDNLYITGRHTRAWEGFGGCFNELGWDALLSLPDAARREIMDGLFGADGLHFDLARLPIGASDYASSWHSYDETEGDFALKHFSIARDRERLFPYVYEALQRRANLRFFASPWSPPTWMKFPAVYNYGKLRMESAYLQTYADYFVRYVTACAENGILIGAVHPQNEPVADQKFPSCVWTGAELAKFLGGYLGPSMAKNAPNTEVWLGTMNTAKFEEMFLPALVDPACMVHLRGIGIQWEGKHAAHKLAAACPHLPLWQTENECGDGKNTWEYAHYVFSLVSQYISAGVSGYVYWNMVLQSGGRSTWGWNQNSLAVVDPASQSWAWQPEFWVFKHLAHFVKPGDIPLRIEGPLAPCAVAFERSEGGIVLAVQNPLGQRINLNAHIGNQELSAALEPRSFHTFII